ncbi:DNA repair protein RAD4 isoform X2 [Cucumis melo]|uniref:DNA repair protein RAD4 isoform X2 n=1 Tax=Cucumis melo TaxID=3656 RepID=A0ABM3L8M0_CUCME|nr:DNA repair protein RAD4 isoform X2 [Cucumis melo]
MRGRKQSQQPKKSSGIKDAGEAIPDPGGSCSQTSIDRANVSRVAVSKLLSRASGRCLSGMRKHALRPCDLSKSTIGKDVNLAMDKKVTLEAERCNENVTASCSEDVDVHEVNLQNSVSEVLEDLYDSDWEDGCVQTSDGTESQPLTIEISEIQEIPDSTKRKPIRRASAADKEITEFVHKVHLLCLLGRGRLIDRACNDPLIQAALLSLLPAHLLKISPAKQLTASSLKPLVAWMHNNFHVRNQTRSEGSINSALAHALETHEGTSEELLTNTAEVAGVGNKAIAALTVVLFRALDITARFVSILDVAPIKPEAERSKCFSQDTSRSSRNIFKNSTLMVDKAEAVDKDSLTSHCLDKKDNPRKRTSGDNRESNAVNLVGKKLHVLDDLSSTTSSNCNSKPDISETFPLKNSQVQKRKGDIEFEMQLQMALSATAVETMPRNSSINHSNEPPLNFTSPKKLKRIDNEESASSSHGISTAVGSSKEGSPLYWAEVYCNAENLTGKWVHIDAVNMVVDGEHKVEDLAAACKTSLRYVVAFSGLGAKDVTRRYCMKWYKIEAKRVNTLWWDNVLAPLRILERQAVGGTGHLEKCCIDGLREQDKLKMSDLSDNLKQKNLLDDGNQSGKSDHNVSEGLDTDRDFSLGNQFVATRDHLEDIELETRALTEPLPTNQQAYKNHRLYALEKWLTKYQILHPKGPVLGFCSGYPVYPRTCVQVLKTKQKWLREGLQVKSNELPVKELKRSIKKIKVLESEADDFDQGDSQGTIPLYGKWQLEPLQLPHAVDGIVPKNERGQVDVWSEKCLPPGTVHISLPRVFSVAKKLEIDYAPALVGFEFRNGRSYPIYDGIVVCSEFKDVILETYNEEAERMEAEERRQREKQAISRWYQLLSSIITRQRLNSRYGDSENPSQVVSGIQGMHDEGNADVPSCQEDAEPFKGQQDNVSNPNMDSPSFINQEDHKHVFLLEDRIFDEKSLVVTKRCHCGFSVQVEEL